ncbi:hypothetical protein ACHAXR_010006 [Thalassiosira sp. AJA248-18]
MPAGLKAKLARAFLNFLDEHGDYRTELEEAAARAAAAEANSLWAKDRRGRKKKRRRGKLKNGEDDANGEEDEWEELDAPSSLPFSEDELLLQQQLLQQQQQQQQPINNPRSQLPEDPYEQIQFYFQTFTHRTRLQLEERLITYQNHFQNWIHDELHHVHHVPLLSGSMLSITILLWIVRARKKAIGRVERVHGILGKKLLLGEYLHTNFLRGHLLLQYSTSGREALDKLIEKANKAEMAALASMRPYQRKKYERFVTLEKWGNGLVGICLVLGMVASGVTLGLSLNSLVMGSVDIGGIGGGEQEELLDGHIYSLDGPTDSDGYPLGMRELAEENYAACLIEAEGRGVDDPTMVCDVDSFFDEAAAAAAAAAASQLLADTTTTTTEEVPSSPLRTKINNILTNHLHLPPPLATYLTTLHSQTIAYLSSLLTFLLFLTSHWISHKIHVATMSNDPMKHFVLTATDKSIKADGTVEAKRGETEAQRKRRERMLQNERLKAQMAQLAMEAKQRVQERRERLEAASSATREAEEKAQKEMEEQDELNKLYGRQSMMLKAGVPDGAILNSLISMGVEDEAEQLEILQKLKALKVRLAREADQEEERMAQKVVEEEKLEEEKERIAAERLRQMKKGGGSSKSSFRTMNSMGSGTKSSTEKKKLGGGGGGAKKKTVAAAAASNASGDSIASSSTIATDPSLAKSAMLSQISSISSGGGGGGGGNFGQPALKSASSRKLPTKIPSNPAPRPGSSTILSGNLPIGAKSDKRWDRESKTWVDAAIVVASSPTGKNKGGATASSPKNNAGTPKKSNTSNIDIVTNTTTADAAAVVDIGNEKTPVRRISSRLKISGGISEEEKKGGEELSSSSPAPESPAARAARETIIAAAVKLPPVMPSTKANETKRTSPDNDNEKGASVKNRHYDDSSSPPVLVRISGEQESPSPMLTTTPQPSSDPFARPTARDIQAQITAVENEPEEGEVVYDEDGNIVDLAPAWLHSPAFESALRNSNASWDRRPSSRDVMARIKAVEQYEEAVHEEKEAKNQLGQHRGSLTRDGLAIIDEGRKIDHPNKNVTATDRDNAGIEFRRKASKSMEDDEISELSEPTYVGNDDARRGIPQALFVPQSADANAALSPVLHGGGGRSRSLVTKENMDRLMKLTSDVNEIGSPRAKENMDRLIKLTSDVNEGGLDAAAATNNDGDEGAVETKKVETAEEQKRRERAEARAKKIEAIAARRNADGKDYDIDDCQSAVSGISKRRDQLRRKKKKEKEAAAAAAALTTTVEENKSVNDGSIKSDDKSGSTPTPKVETEEEKKRRVRAMARAKKLEAMAARRNAGLRENAGDDGTAVTGISKRHRLRRKKSAMAANAISPEEQERIDWKQNIYTSVLNAERVQWQTSIYTHVIAAETTKSTNMESRRLLDEQNASAQRLIEHQKRLDKKAKKFAARAERFHKIRRADSGPGGGGGGEDDDDGAGSVVSSASRMRRKRRGRKSSSMSLLASSSGVNASLVEEEPTATTAAPAAAPMVPTAEEREIEKRQAWCNSIYSTILQSHQSQWKTHIYTHVLTAQESKTKRRELEATIAKEQAAAQLRKEKERQNELRAKKMERIHKLRREGNRPNGDEGDDGAGSVVSSASRMRRRRNKKSSSSSAATIASAQKLIAASGGPAADVVEETSSSVPALVEEEYAMAAPTTTTATVEDTTAVEALNTLEANESDERQGEMEKNDSVGTTGEHDDSAGTPGEGTIAPDDDDDGKPQSDDVSPSIATAATPNTLDAEKNNDAGTGEENIAPDDSQSAVVASSTATASDADGVDDGSSNVSSMKKMRNRRKKAAKKNSSKK